MPAPPEMGHLKFDPPIRPYTEEYKRAWFLLKEMNLTKEVVFSYKGNMDLHGLTFPTKEQAMMFRLRL